MKLLASWLLRHRNLINKHKFWVNTTDKEDIAFMTGLVNEYPSFFEMVHPTRPITGNYSIYQFYKDCVDPNTVYIRLDDDIVWIAEDAISNLVEYRRNNPNPTVVFGNIVNNAICSHLHQRQGALSLDIGRLSYNAMCPHGWNSGPVAAEIHKQFIKTVSAGDPRADRFRFHKWILWEYQRFSINCFAWFGKDFATFGGIVDTDEEMAISETIPAKLGRPNEICGQALFSHFAFHPQREYLDKCEDIGQNYRRLAPGC